MNDLVLCLNTMRTKRCDEEWCEGERSQWISGMFTFQFTSRNVNSNCDKSPHFHNSSDYSKFGFRHFRLHGLIFNLLYTKIKL